MTLSTSIKAKTQTDLALMLADLVCTDDRPAMWHDGTAYITNGHTGFLIEGVDQPVDWCLWEGDRWANPEFESRCNLSPDRLREVFSIKGTPVIGYALPAIDPHRSWSSPREVIATTCDECHGSGDVTCNYGHDHECEDCKGTGKVTETRIDVEYHSNLSTKDRAIETPGGHVERRYLWIASKLAEHRQLSYQALSGTMIGLSFSFDGGSGLIMGINFR